MDLQVIRTRGNWDYHLNPSSLALAKAVSASAVQPSTLRPFLCWLKVLESWRFVLPIAVYYLRKDDQNEDNYFGSK